MTRNLREGRDEAGLDSRLLAWLGKCPVGYTLKRIGGCDINIYHELGKCQHGKQGLVAMEVTKLQGIKFSNGVCCKVCAVPVETCNGSMIFGEQGRGECFYKGVVHEAVAAIMVVGPDTVVEKMYKWM
jgi:hypothetical protein